jgi:hypothetical protein
LKKELSCPLKSNQEFKDQKITDQILLFSELTAKETLGSTTVIHSTGCCFVVCTHLFGTGATDIQA